MRQAFACDGCGERRGRHYLGGRRLCEPCLNGSSESQRRSDRPTETWYVTENGQTAHRSLDCSALIHATVVETLTTAEVDDDYVLRRCDRCQYDTVPTLAD